MSDKSTEPTLSDIMAVLNRLEAGQTALRTDVSRLEAGQTALRTDVNRLESSQTGLRADLMARMDRLQGRMDETDEHLTLGLGHTDQVEVQAKAVGEGNRQLGEMMRAMQRLVIRLGGRVADLENKL